MVSNSSGKIAVSAVTATELGYLDGVTSAIQTQLNGKANTALSNLTTAGKLACATYALPHKTSITEISIGASDTKYTAPKDGYFMFIGALSSGIGYVRLVNQSGNLRITMPINTSNGNGNGEIFLPVNSGDSTLIRYNGTFANVYLYFVPLNGAN